MKSSLISSVSYFNLGVEALFGALNPQKPLRGDGTEIWTPVTAYPSAGGTEGG